MTEPVKKMTVQSVLEYLVRAGEAGATTTEMAQAFTYPQSYHQRSNRASQVMLNLAGRGCAEKTGTEPTKLYRNTPVSRWRVTAAGVTLHQSTESAQARGERVNAMHQFMAATAGRRRDALAAARMRTAALYASGAGITRCYRRAMILELRAVPCTLAEIGELFGIQRERVRQIESGQERPCACRACVTA